MHTEVRAWFKTTNASLDISTFQIMHLRNYKGTKTGLLTDPTMLKGWQDVFGTTSRQVVEEELRKSGAEFQWRDGDSLRIVDRGSAIEKHPVTGEKIWFNHSQVMCLRLPKVSCLGL